MFGTTEMTFDTFKSEVLAKLKDHLPLQFADERFRVIQIPKFNEMVDALELEGNPQYGHLNLNALYQDYVYGHEMEAVLQNAADALLNHNASNSHESICELSSIRDRLFIRICSYDRNKEYLMRVPYQRSGDFALTYNMLIEQVEDCVISVEVTNEDMEAGCFTKDDLHEAAIENCMQKHPLLMENLDTYARKQLRLQMEKDGVPGFLIEIALNEMLSEPVDDIPIYVVTNTSGVNGAAVLFYPGSMEAIAEKIGGGYYVIPSSIHDLIVLPDDTLFPLDVMLSMVPAVNRQRVSEKSQLSDIPYHYDAEKKVFERAVDYVERIKGISAAHDYDTLREDV